jgi:uncharacterized protein (DUF486 family)
MRTVLLLIASNAFMTVAWYGHLKFKGVPLWQAIVVSWGIAFFEYCLQVPANRWGSGQFSVTQLKIMQEVITLSIFTLFSLVVFREVPRWNHVVAYALIIAAVGFAFLPGKGTTPPGEGTPPSVEASPGGS